MHIIDIIVLVRAAAHATHHFSPTQKNPPARPEEHQIRPLQLGNPLWNTSNLMLTQPMHSAPKMEARKWHKKKKKKKAMPTLNLKGPQLTTASLGSL